MTCVDCDLMAAQGRKAKDRVLFRLAPPDWCDKHLAEIQAKVDRVVAKKAAR